MRNTSELYFGHVKIPTDRARNDEILELKAVGQKCPLFAKATKR